MKKIRSLIRLTAACLLSFFVFTFNMMTALAYMPIVAEIPVTCLEIPDGRVHTYNIIIESENSAFPAPRSNAIEITDTETGKFEIEIDEPGTFVYKVYEKEGSEPDINYDKNVYIVTVFVEEASDNTLKYAVIAKLEETDEKPDTIEFEDTVDDDEIVTTETTDPVPTETDVTTTDTDSSADTSSYYPESTTPKVTTAVTTTTTADRDHDDTENPITGLIDSVLTGNSLTAHTIRIVMLSFILITISTFLFKRDNNEEEDKNEK